MAAFDGADGRGIGVARFVRNAEDPGLAEAAVTVTDDAQGRGLGTALLARLADRAREEGVDRFSALVLADNRDMLELLERAGEVRHRDIEAASSRSRSRSSRRAPARGFSSSCARPPRAWSPWRAPARD